MILVAGSTGILGGLIARRLLSAGDDVRILIRHNSQSDQLALEGLATSGRSLIELGAKPVYGDLKDRASLAQACAGIQTVITTANSAMRGGDDTVDTVDRQGNRNLIEAAKAAGVGQFIFTSFLGASPENPVPLFQAKAEIESFLAVSGIPYTILSPNFFIESWAGMVVGIPIQVSQPVTLVGEAKRQHSLISVGDVAAFAASAVGHPAALSRKLILGGPEPLNWREVVNAFSNIIGRDLPINFVAPGEPIPLLPEIVPPMLAAMETYESIIPMEETARTFGIQLTPLTEVVRRMLNIPAL